jgi:hypothetical protein
VEELDVGRRIILKQILKEIGWEEVHKVGPRGGIL